MRNNKKSTWSKAWLAAPLLGLSAAALADEQVNLTAGASSANLPDGSAVPMWGYSCGAVVAGSKATCAALNPNTAGWSPVILTVPTGSDLTINLTNNLKFTTPSNATNGIPTSIVIVGQLGGGLGNSATSTASPDHSAAQQLTWPIANPGTRAPAPLQGPRVQSFASEVAPGATSSGVTWRAVRAGTYLIESGTHPSIQGAMGLYGILVVTNAPTSNATVNNGVATTTETAAGTAYPGINYDAEVALLLSEIDPVQNSAVQAAVATDNFSETKVWSGQPGGCGNPASGANYRTCYPPAVNYTPLYYLFNGVAFDKTHAVNSWFATSPGNTLNGAGTVLVRFVNAGLRMHVPSIVGATTASATSANASGMGLIAEDGNPVPGARRVQSEVFLAAGKTYDVLVNATSGGTALPVFDRELSLSANATARDAGMLAYLGVNGAALPGATALGSAVARPDTYNSIVAGNTLTVSDPAKGVIANDTNVYGVSALTAPTQGVLTLNANGTFTYVASAGWTGVDSFSYCANGTVSGGTCSSGVSATVTLGAGAVESASGITINGSTFTSTLATSLAIKAPGILTGAKDGAGYPLTVALKDGNAPVPSPGLTLAVDPMGGFTASVPGPGTYTFTFKAQNSQGTVSANSATVTLVFPPPSGLSVSVVDGKTGTPITDYRWIIEEDRTFYVDPNKTQNNGGNAVVPTFGTNFHTSYMPVVATGCVGPTDGTALSCESGQTVYDPVSKSHVYAVCDAGNGAVCRTSATPISQTPVSPSQVALDPKKRYYLSILPGDAANPFQAGNLSACLPATDPNYVPSSCGHGMGGAPIAAGQTSVTVLVQPTPFPTAKLSVFVFEDDFPLNGENDADGIAANEPGLGGFNITLFDEAGGTGDATGQMTYDMFNQPLGNALDGTIDPQTGLNACPITKQGASKPTGITGTIVTCPRYESDGMTFSPLTGQAVVANLMPGRFGVVATPGADHIGKGEEWLQTNTLDGQKAHDSFLRIGEPSYFQEFGPAGYHVSIGFANPKIINDRLPLICNGDPSVGTQGVPCNNTVKGSVSTTRISRTPDERLYGSGSYGSFGFTQCYISIGDPAGEDFAFTKCNQDGTWSIPGLPDGSWRITVFDQWNDMLVDGLSTPVALKAGATAATTDVGEIATNQWQANIYTRTFLDTDKSGVSTDSKPGLPLVATNIRFRDGSFSNFNNTDLNGFAGFNEVFPLFNWYVIETDSTRYKNTGTHVVYDSGGPTDGSAACGKTGYPACGSSTAYANMANTNELTSPPAALRVPGAVYCASADCGGKSIQNGPASSDTGALSTGRIDPPWVLSEGWQGFSGQNSFVEFGKTPFAPGENGGIHGHVIYASTRPFDDPQLLLQTRWEPLVPNVTINLYQEGTAPDGSTSRTLVDTTTTSSWDDWAQGFRSDGVPNMNCPGQGRDTGPVADIFFFTLFNQPMYLDAYNNGGAPVHTLPNNSQFKCFDGMHNWNQVQPAPYDGMYQFPSVTLRDPVTGAPTASNCTACIPNPADGTPMLPNGKYVVEVVVPPGYELVKEEDKNILIGDNFIAPATVQFPNLATAVYILPDQAQVSAFYNANNPQNPTQSLGRSSALPSHEGDTGSIETFWPCVGQMRIVPDFISLFPHSAEVSPFAGALRPLCDRKEVTLDDQTAALAKFYVFTSTHVAAHFTGVITDDFTSEFDPFSPQWGEKFAPPNLPVAIKDWTGAEISRVYADQWGAYNGLTYSTWEVNPPNPTGYAPTMMVTCMNDPGTGATPDPLYNPQYSQFCYEIPFMPGQTQYMDTPVVPTSAFAGAGYNNPDCAYPALTPAIKQVTGDSVAGDSFGPWVSAAGHSITITALGDVMVPNNAYAGPSATTAPYNQKTVSRHYGFGGTKGTVKIGGVAVPANQITTWNDGTITLNVPAGIPNCPLQQQEQFGGSNARCGQLVITRGDANHLSSIDSITVTVGGSRPKHVKPTDSIQVAIDAAKPGDMLIIDPAVHQEMVLMWKPVRLQGVGAASSIINANTHPAGKFDPWRRQVDCLFGIALNGTPITDQNPYDPSNTFTCPASMRFQVDRLPLEPTVGWDASQNGNLAEQLQEPSLMGAYEGAGITVLGKGVKFPRGSNPFAAETFPPNTRLLTRGDCRNDDTNPYPSNFYCNPASIDGLAIHNSSQGGGGVFAHGWAHNLQIANDRIYNNSGTLSGGISIGQGQFPPQYLKNGTTPNKDPGSCQDDGPTNTQEPYCFNVGVSVHHNMVTLNSSPGDALFSSTPSGAGGVAFCTGADNYKFQFNWVCGNLSTGDGGGVVHLGFIYNGDIEHNSILFNQSTNPTVPTNGGGLAVLGTPDTDPVCGVEPDADCPPGTSDGTGPGLLINANLFLGNSADSGSGGAIRLHGVNGTEVTFFPGAPSNWYTVNITNNIIANNVAGWDGAGVSLQDALSVNFINNTVMSNDTTASAGVLFNTLGAPLSTSPPPGQTFNGTSSLPQPAGLVAIPNSPTLVATLNGRPIQCPAAHPNCTKLSNPVLTNNLFWQNRAFYVGVGAFSAAFQQNTVTLFNAFTTNAVTSQASTGACPAGASYWDLGVRGDATPSSHDSGFTLTPTYSVVTDLADYSAAALHNLGSNPAVTAQYCNGSRIPPELKTGGYQVPPGISDATVPNPVFNLSPAATVDEGNNWVNMSWGPLALTNPVSGMTLGNYAPTGASPVIDMGTDQGAPTTDFFGNPRPSGTEWDIGAVEVSRPNGADLDLSPQSLNFGALPRGRTSPTQFVTVTNTGNGNLSVTGLVFSGAGYARATGFGLNKNCPTTFPFTRAPGQSCRIYVTFTPASHGTTNGTLTVNSNDASPDAATDSVVQLTGRGTRLQVSPDSLVFVTLSQGFSGTQTVTVTNTSTTANDRISGITAAISGLTNGVTFQVASNNCPANLNPGASCQVRVRFRSPTPFTLGTGTLTISDSEPASGAVTLLGVRFF